MAVIEFSNHPERYSKKDGKWIINASTGSLITQPYTFPANDRIINFEPLLNDNVLVIIKIGERYLCSPGTLEELGDNSAENPHWWYDVRHVLTTPSTSGSVSIGGTVPIIELDLDTILELADIETELLPYSGVKDVQWIFEGDSLITPKLIEQLNYCLSEGTQRPADEWQLWDLNLSADYSINQLKIEAPTTEGASIDKQKLADNLMEINKRIKGLRTDFNNIKNIFYNGEKGKDMVSYSEYKSAAIGSLAPETAIKVSDTAPVVFKTSEIVEVKTPPAQAATEADIKAVDKTITDATEAAIKAVDTTGKALDSFRKTRPQR
jgi:hypothetical protein